MFRSSNWLFSSSGSGVLLQIFIVTNFTQCGKIVNFNKDDGFQSKDILFTVFHNMTVFIVNQMFELEQQI